jgi:solute carrier family 15 oligopeptide transporter 1
MIIIIFFLFQPTYATIPGDGRMQLNFINTLPCKVNVEYEVTEKNGNFELQGNMYEFVQDLEAEQDIIVRAFLDKPDCAGYTQFVNIDTGIVSLGIGDGTQGYSILITERENNLTITRLDKEEQLEKSNTGDPYVA